MNLSFSELFGGYGCLNCMPNNHSDEVLHASCKRHGDYIDRNFDGVSVKDHM